MAAEQLPLVFTVTRFELKPTYTTWREGSETKIEEQGERSIDCAWPWLRKKTS